MLKNIKHQIDFFNENGYLVVENLIPHVEFIGPVIQEYRDLLDSLCSNWIAEGLLDKSVMAQSFQQKMVCAIQAGCDYFQPMDISLPTGNITHTTPMHTGKKVFNLLTNPYLLTMVEHILGTELSLNPIQHVRLKPPGKNVAQGEKRSQIVATSMHQDMGVTNEEANDTPMLTCWIAVTNASEENGCLHVVPRSHKNGLFDHCPLPQVGIPDEFLNNQQPLPLPVSSGAVIFLNPYTIHGAASNDSATLRWSFDIRFHKTGYPSGRSQFPKFQVKSAQSDQLLLDWKTWKNGWLETRRRLSKENSEPYHRWSEDSVYCA